MYSNEQNKHSWRGQLAKGRFGEAFHVCSLDVYFTSTLHYASANSKTLEMTSLKPEHIW